MFSKYKNKYFSVLGDSASTFEGCSEPEYAAYYDTAHKLASGVLTRADTWWGQVIDRLGGELLVNNSFSGSTVCWHPAFEIPSYGCSNERTSSLGRDGISPDVIMVYMGMNDWGHGFRVRGDERYDSGINNPTLFLTAYSSMLTKLRINYPNAEIWCFTLPISRCSAEQDFKFPYYFGGRHIGEYCEAIRECAAEDGCRLIDLYHSMDAYDTVDEFHPSADGMNAIAEGVMRELQARLSDNVQ